MGVLPTTILRAGFAYAIFILTIALVIWQPRGLGIGWSALGGAILSLATGVVTLDDIIQVWGIVGNATFTLVALLIIALVLQEAGFFRWLAIDIVRRCVGSGRLLFILVMLMGASVTAVLTNYGTVLILTALVVEILLSLGFRFRFRVAFVLAIGWIADTTSMLLTVSNPLNLITADYFHIDFWRYLLVMGPVSLVALATSLGVFYFYFYRYIPPYYSDAELPRNSSTVIRSPLVCRWSFTVLGLLVLGYFLADLLGIPVCLIAAIGALVMLALAGRRPRIISTTQILRQVPWQAIVFSLGMYIVVIGVINVGFTSIISGILEQLAHWGFGIAIAGTGFLATLVSAAINHLPTVLINNVAIKNAVGVDRAIQEAMVYANIIGCNIGAKITPIGSLSTLLWLEILARKNIRFSWGQYLRFSIVLTIPVLFVTLLSLAIWFPWLVA